MTKAEWLLKFRRCQRMETLEKVYEHLKYKGAEVDELLMTQAYDHRKAEFAAGRLFDRVPPSVWRLVK